MIGVAPGKLATEMSSFTRTDADRATVLGMEAFRRLAQPEDIAGAVAFPAFDAARDYRRHPSFG